MCMLLNGSGEQRMLMVDVGLNVNTWLSCRLFCNRCQTVSVSPVTGAFAERAFVLPLVQHLYR